MFPCCLWAADGRHQNMEGKIFHLCIHTLTPTVSYTHSRKPELSDHRYSDVGHGSRPPLHISRFLSLVLHHCNIYSVKASGFVYVSGRRKAQPLPHLAAELTERMQTQRVFVRAKYICVKFHARTSHAYNLMQARVPASKTHACIKSHTHNMTCV